MGRVFGAFWPRSRDGFSNGANPENTEKFAEPRTTQGMARGPVLGTFRKRRTFWKGSGDNFTLVARPARRARLALRPPHFPGAG